MRVSSGSGDGRVREALVSREGPARAGERRSIPEEHPVEVLAGFDTELGEDLM
jgi:hypothetical protein